MQEMTSIWLQISFLKRSPTDSLEVVHKNGTQSYCESGGRSLPSISNHGGQTILPKSDDWIGMLTKSIKASAILVSRNFPRFFFCF